MAKKIAAMAEVHYAQIAPHLYCGPVEQAANIHIGISTPNFLIQETIERMDGFHAKIVTEPIRWENGYVLPSDQPGLGVELDEEVARQHPCNDQLWD
jgi:2-dehydro-3-deoxyphosphogalactonate aldolase